jgi:2-oxoglutarate ferredoxin oxidoreductase subunit gamma
MKRLISPLALTQEACTKYYVDLKGEGILLVDEDFVTELPEGNYRVIKLPIIRSAQEKVGKAFVANIVAIGAITALVERVGYDSVEKAVLSRVPRGTEDLNKIALKIGYDMAKAKIAG